MVSLISAVDSAIWGVAASLDEGIAFGWTGQIGLAFSNLSSRTSSISCFICCRDMGGSCTFFFNASIPVAVSLSAPVSVAREFCYFRLYIFICRLSGVFIFEEFFLALNSARSYLGVF